MRLEMSPFILEKYSNIKFLENQSTGSRVIPCGHTDGRAERRTSRHDEANSRFSQLCEQWAQCTGTLLSLEIEIWHYYWSPHRG